MNFARIKVIRVVLVICFFLTAVYPVYGEDDTASFIISKRKELNEREKQLNEERRKIEELKADIEEKLANYENMLTELQKILERFKEMNTARMKSVVKDYESMRANAASDKLSGLNEELAANILLKMNPRKAGKAMALMETRKAVSLTERMANITKNFPRN